MFEIAILLLICAVSIWLTRSSGHSLFAPWNLMILAQFGSLAVAYTKMSPEMKDLNWLTWVVILASLVMFELGCLVAWSNPDRSRRLDLDERRVFHVAMALFGVYMFGVAMGLVSQGTFPMFAKDPSTARGIFIWPPPLGRVAGFAQAWASGVLLLLSWLTLRASSRKVRLVSWVLTAVMLGLQILIGTRFNLFSWFIYWIVLRDDAGRKALSLGKYALLMTGMFLLMSFLFVLRFGASNVGQFISWDNWPLIRAFALMPLYLYFANNFWNLDYVMEKVLAGAGHACTYGFSSLWGVFFFAGFPMDMAKTMGWDMALDFRGQSTVDERLNTLTYHWELFKDFGLGGVLIGSFAFGVFATWIYRKTVRMQGEGWTLWNALFGFSIAMSFFTLAWAQAPFLICVLAVWIATYRKDAKN